LNFSAQRSFINPISIGTEIPKTPSWGTLQSPHRINGIH